MNIDVLKNSVKDLPRSPGVYIMKNKQGKFLYVGKASNLKSRVNSYFSREGQSRYQVKFLMSKVAAIETILTDNAKEALLLENILIKKHRPRYNIDLKDDKSYVSLKLSVGQEAPRLYVTRRIKKDGSLYYGPYTSAGACREVVDFIQNHFRLRTCSDHDYRNRVRPCLQYQIKRCDAPCVGRVSLAEYDKMVGQVRMFLEGKNRELIKVTQAQMKISAREERFEDAARYRDLLEDIARTLEKQKVVSHELRSRDVLGSYREGEGVMIYLMRIREGVLQGRAQFYLKSLEELGELMATFLIQYYGEDRPMPREILLPCPLEESKELSEILSERAHHRVQLKFPRRGEDALLKDLANQNAKQSFLQRVQKEKDQKEILASLQAKLHLNNLPERIECYDISNFQGDQSMGSMVTFLHGKPERKLYRHFKIKSVRGSNDYASLYEVLARRLKRSGEGAEAGKDEPWRLPDLLVIDGGKGQLNAAAQALKDLKIQGVDLISLAKSRLLSGDTPRAALEDRERSEERVFLLGRKNPVHLAQNSSELYLLVQARDEAHRFGIESHRKLRQKSSLYSGLDQIEGVGKVRRQKLLKHFGSLKRIKDASLENLVQILGGSKQLARRVKESL